LGIGAALLAGVLPAWRAAGSALAETLRRRGLERPEGLTLLGWSIRGLVGLAIVAALVGQSVTRSAMWGLVATGLIALGTALAARPLLCVIHYPLGLVLDYLPRATGRFAVRAVTRNPRRSALSIGMLGVGVGSVIWLWILAHSFQSSVINTLGRAFRADLILSSSHIASGFDDSPIDGALVDEVMAVPGVEAAIGERILDWHYAGGPISIDAFDPPYFRAGDFGRWPLFGTHVPDVWDAVAQGDAVIVSANFVHNLHLGVGEQVLL